MNLMIIFQDSAIRDRLHSPADHSFTCFESRDCDWSHSSKTQTHIGNDVGTSFEMNQHACIDYSNVIFLAM